MGFLMNILHQRILQSLSPSSHARRAAECALSVPDNICTDLLFALLNLISAFSHDHQVALAAAVRFKNLIRSRWSLVPVPKKNQIKSLVLNRMVSSPSPLVQSQLSECLSIVTSDDFHQSCFSLLPKLVMFLRLLPGSSEINRTLAAAKSIFLKLRHPSNANLRPDLNSCIDPFASTFLVIFFKISSLISTPISGGVPLETLSELFETQRLCCEIFHSLNAIGLPELLEEHAHHWMSEFRVYLKATYAPELETNGSADKLRATVCENLELYMEEKFADYLEGCVSDVYHLLITPATATSPFRDQLTINAIRFLTKVSTSVHHSLFSNSVALQEICHKIVFPNVRLRDEEEEFFKTDDFEYIMGEIEGSDIDTRRSIASQLLKGLALNYKEEVTALVSMEMRNMLRLNRENPHQNWKEKVSAINLALSLGTKVMHQFFARVIAPELQPQQDFNVSSSPMVKAAALKFFTAFRELIPKQASMPLLPHVISSLLTASGVVRSYAANCIEKLLSVRWYDPSSDLGPLIPSLLTNLLLVQSLKSEANPYVMKCVMRVLSVASVDSYRQIISLCSDQLAFLVRQVTNNPKKYPSFNHYLFEAIAALIAEASKKDDPSLITLYEAHLSGALQGILVLGVTELFPYSFQILAQIIEVTKPPLSERYLGLFWALLSPHDWQWSNSGPALVLLLQAYLRKMMPAELYSEGRLNRLLEIVNKLLVKSTSNEKSCFSLLETLVKNLGSDVLAPYMGNIWSVLFSRLHCRGTVNKFVETLIIFMSLVLVYHGTGFLVDSINSVQPNMFKTILQMFWIPNLNLISGMIEVRLVLTASARLLLESPTLLDASAQELRDNIFENMIDLLLESQGFRETVENEPPEVPESGEYPRLRYAAGKKDEEDTLKRLRDQKHFLVSLSETIRPRPRNH